MAAFAAALLLLPQLAAAAFPFPPNLATSVLLNDPDPTGARCLDGTPPRIWVHKSASANPESRKKWAWHFQGGGWCESEESCTQRAFAPSQCMLGSSREECFNANGCNVMHFKPVMDFFDLPAVNGARWGGGLLNNSAGTNPLTHDWNKVLMMYCDGGSYSGNNATPSMVFDSNTNTTRPMFYRGARNLHFALETLQKDWGMAEATDILISGDSAGGLASYWHADRFGDAFPKAFVATVPDSGFFIGDDTKPEWPTSLQWIASAMNSTTGLDASCVAAAAKAGKQTPGQACTLPEDVAPHVQVPLFVMNSKYDPAMISISSKVSSPDAINGLAERFVAKVESAVLAPSAVNKNPEKNGAFITGCHEHCGQWAQGQQAGENSDFNVTIDGMTAPFAVQAWYNHNKQQQQQVGSGSGEQASEEQESEEAASSSPFSQQPFVHMATAKYPCLNCCKGGDGSSNNNNSQ